MAEHEPHPCVVSSSKLPGLVTRASQFRELLDMLFTSSQLNILSRGVGISLPTPCHHSAEYRSTTLLAQGRSGSNFQQRGLNILSRGVKIHLQPIISRAPLYTRNSRNVVFGSRLSQASARSTRGLNTLGPAKTAAISTALRVVVLSRSETINGSARPWRPQARSQPRVCVQECRWENIKTTDFEIEEWHADLPLEENIRLTTSSVCWHSVAGRCLSFGKSGMLEGNL